MWRALKRGKQRPREHADTAQQPSMGEALASLLVTVGGGKVGGRGRCGRNPGC